MEPVCLTPASDPNPSIELNRTRDSQFGCIYIKRWISMLYLESESEIFLFVYHRHARSTCFVPFLYFIILDVGKMDQFHFAALKIMHPKFHAHGLICWQENKVSNTVRNLNSIHQSLENTRINFLCKWLLLVVSDLFLG